MSALAWAAFVAAAACGAVLRFVIDAWVIDRTKGLFPWGTLLVNLTGSIVLGFLTGLGLYHAFGSTPRFVLGTGFCGAYTTFSTFSFETVRLLEEGALNDAMGNAFGTLTVCAVGAAAGLAVASL